MCALDNPRQGWKARVRAAQRVSNPGPRCNGTSVKNVNSHFIFRMSIRFDYSRQGSKF